LISTIYEIKAKGSRQSRVIFFSSRFFSLASNKNQISALRLQCFLETAMKADEKVQMYDGAGQRVTLQQALTP
jgi:hypothetical protein